MSVSNELALRIPTVPALRKEESAFDQRMKKLRAKVEFSRNLGAENLLNFAARQN